MVRYEIRFVGRVQGVGFRFFTCMNGEKCHLTGWVKNMDDGSVVAQVQGLDSNVDKFLEMMYNTNAFIRIDSADKKIIDLVEGERKFQTKY